MFQFLVMTSTLNLHKQSLFCGSCMIKSSIVSLYQVTEKINLVEQYKTERERQQKVNRLEGTLFASYVN